MRDLLRRAVAAVLLQDVEPVEVEPVEVECDCPVCQLVEMYEALAAIEAAEVEALEALYAAPAYGENGWSPMS